MFARRGTALLVGVVSGFVGTACGREDAARLDANIVVEASAAPKLTVSFPTGGIVAPGRRVLGNGESLSAEYGGASVSLVAVGSGASHHYEALLPSLVGGGMVRVRLRERTGREAIVSLQVPAPFAITEPKPATRWSMDEPLRIVLNKPDTQAGTRQSVSVSGDCVRSYFAERSGGDVEWLVRSTELVVQNRASNSCASGPLRIEVRRRWSGAPSTSSGGALNATVIERVSVEAAL
ncbi:MAG: hypothetical protein KIT84_13620 [Labilithrix sp.]|nr:hypothetical protein [Labilithrix sp.]MCW5812057.1 hypothetical protein [Labilithrix sp.]